MVLIHLRVMYGLIVSEISYMKKTAHLPFFFDMKPFRDTRSLLQDVKNDGLSYLPDVIVLQVGIVDCYPRALTKFELQIVSRIPVLNRLSKAIVKRYYTSIVKKRNIAYVSLSEYERNLIMLKFLFQSAKWIVLPIAPPSKSYIQKNPLISERVKAYNAAQKKVFGDDFKDELYSGFDLNRTFLSDNHHLSKYGHENVRYQVLQYITQHAVSDKS